MPILRCKKVSGVNVNFIALVEQKVPDVREALRNLRYKIINFKPPSSPE